MENFDISRYEPYRQNLVPPHWIGARIPADGEEFGLVESLVTLPPELLKTHALAIGATGSGKTNFLHHVIARDVLFGHGFAVLDMRGDLFNASVELCAGRVDPQKVLLLDLREKNAPVGFNPLHGAGESYFRALGVLDAVESESSSWGVQLSETMRYGLMLLAEARAPLTRLEDLFYDQAFLHGCLDECRSGTVRAFFQRFDELSVEKRATLAMPVLNKLAPVLATQTLRNILGHRSPFDLGRHLSTPGSVTLVSLAVDELHTSGRMFGRIFLASFCREVFARVSMSEHARVPVRLIVDEFEHFGSTEFESILAEGRKFKLSLILAHQTLAQLSPKLRSLILGNVGTKLVFRAGREDGPLLSRDLTGDPKAYDFAEFRTGEAIMWNRGLGITHLDINEPIIRDAGRLSARARQFVREVHSSAQQAHQVDEESAIHSPSDAPPAATTEDSSSDAPHQERPARERPGSGESWEDWLCD